LQQFFPSSFDGEIVFKKRTKAVLMFSKSEKEK